MRSIAKYTPPATPVGQWLPITVRNNRIVSIGSFPLVVPVCIPDNVNPASLGYVRDRDRSGRAIYYFVYFGPDHNNAVKWATIPLNHIFCSANVKVEKVTRYGTTSGSAWRVNDKAIVNGKLTICHWDFDSYSGKRVSGDPSGAPRSAPNGKKYVRLTVISIPGTALPIL